MYLAHSPHVSPYLLCFVLVFLVTCFAPASQANSRTESPAQALRVTLLLEHTGSIWTDALTKGLARAEQEFSLRTRLVVESDETRQEAVFRACAKSADLLIVATDRFHEILRDNARAFPSVRFACLDASIRSANVSCITFADEQAAFLAGFAAAAFAEPRTQGQDAAIGWISGDEIPALQSLFHGFSEGAKLAKPDIRVIHGCTHSFTNPAKGAKEARRLLKEGVVVLAMAAGASNAGILDEARAAGIHVIGLDRDLKDSYPGHVLLSIVKDIEGAVYRLVREAATQAFQGKEIRVYDLKEGVRVTDPLVSLETKDPRVAHIRKRLKELTHELNSGGIRVKSLRTRTLCNCL